MKKTASINRIVTVALNPAIDRVLEVSHLTIGAHQHARLLNRTAAGKAVNVARGLSLLDVPCVLTGLVGQAEQDFFTHDLQDTKVQVRMMPVAGRTRENITLVDPVSRTETHLRDRGFQITPNELASIKRILGELAAAGTLFIFSGSLPPGISPTDQQEMLRICRSAGSLVAADASGPALPAAIAAGPWLIKPNRLELEELLGRSLPSRDDLLTAGHELAKTIPLVLVSAGEQGAYLFAGDEAWHGQCTVPAERMVSTVGCGDALLTGFAAGLYKNQGLTESLQTALAAAAATATNQAATFTRQAFDEFLPTAKAVSLTA